MGSLELRREKGKEGREQLEEESQLDGWFLSAR